IDNKAKIDTQPFFEEYKKLIADGANSIDPKVRKPIYDRLQEIIADEGWVITTAFWLTFTAFSKRIQGYRATLSPPTFEGVWVQEYETRRVCGGPKRRGRDLVHWQAAAASDPGALSQQRGRLPVHPPHPRRPRRDDGRSERDARAGRRA